MWEKSLAKSRSSGWNRESIKFFLLFSMWPSLWGGCITVLTLQTPGGLQILQQSRLCLPLQCRKSCSLDDVNNMWGGFITSEDFPGAIMVSTVKSLLEVYKVHLKLLLPFTTLLNDLRVFLRVKIWSAHPLPVLNPACLSCCISSRVDVIECMMILQNISTWACVVF